MHSVYTEIYLDQISRTCSLIPKLPNILLFVQVVRSSSQDVPTAYGDDLEAATIVQPEQVVKAIKDSMLWLEAHLNRLRDVSTVKKHWSLWCKTTVSDCTYYTSLLFNSRLIEKRRVLMVSNKDIYLGQIYWAWLEFYRSWRLLHLLSSLNET